MKKLSPFNSYGVTLRSVLIGLLLIPPNCYWVVQSEAVWGTTYLTIVSLFFNVTFSLFILVCFNNLFRRIFRFGLSQKELLTIYIMLCLGSSVAGNNFLENLILSLGHAFWFATPENEWSELFFRFVPDWLAVKDRNVLTGFYEGESSIYDPENINAWLKPLFFWGSFALVLIFTLLCVNVIIRKEWTEREKLSYPIIQLPLELTRDGTGSKLFSNKLFLIGFGLAATITIINGLHFHFPSVPNLRLRTNIGYLFTEKPWNAIGWMPVALYLWVVGIVYFIPLDLCFSCWFFYLFAKSQLVIGSIFGLSSLPGFPYLNQQSTGGWIALFLIAIWLTRRHLMDVFIRAFRRERSQIAEPMSYRSALIGFILGFSFLVLFCVAGGMSLWVGILFFVLLIALETTITRMRAELGPPLHELFLVGPDTILATIFGTQRLGGANLTMMTYLYFTDRTVSSHSMPHQLEGFKIAERAGIDNRKLVMVMMCATFVGIVSALWSLLHSAYKTGVASGFIGYTGLPWESFNRLGWWLRYPGGTNYPEMGFIAGGLIFSIIMMFLRVRFLWWQLHPVGYALSTSGWVINYIWFSFVVGWLIKWIILKHGNIRTYRNATPFFFGLILGEYTLGCLWCLIGIIFGFQTYGFFES